MKKPHKKIYVYTLKKLGAKPHECIFIDNLKRNTDSAKKLGIKTIHFRNSKQLRKDLTRLSVKI